MPNKILTRLAKVIFITAFVVLPAITAFGYFFWYKPKFRDNSSEKGLSIPGNRTFDSKEVIPRLKLKAALAKEYVKKHSFNLTHCFLLDMKIPSGKNRFFVYDLKKDSVAFAGLVTHGSGSEEGADELNFSNQPNSYCTSLGKYKIGKSYNGYFGCSYKLHGLDTTNSKAFDRFVVLHSHACVPNDEVFPRKICVSLGCPTVSPLFLQKLKAYLDESKQPVLLWIYY